MAEYTREQKRREIAREVKMRRRVYPHMIAQGKMTRAEADYALDVMLAILLDYEDEKTQQEELPLANIDTASTI